MIDEMRYKIIDNFLGDAEFIALTNNIFPIFDKSPNGKPDFPWIYVNQQLRGDYPEPDHLKKVTDIKLLNPIHDWYFTHIFWNGIYQSPLLGVIVPLLNKIDPQVIDCLFKIDSLPHLWPSIKLLLYVKFLGIHFEDHYQQLFLRQPEYMQHPP